MDPLGIDSRLAEAIAYVREKVADAPVHPIALELSSLQDVRRAAEEINSLPGPIDVSDQGRMSIMTPRSCCTTLVLPRKPIILRTGTPSCTPPTCTRHSYLQSESISDRTAPWRRGSPKDCFFQSFSSRRTPRESSSSPEASRPRHLDSAWTIPIAETSPMRGSFNITPRAR